MMCPVMYLSNHFSLSGRRIYGLVRLENCNTATAEYIVPLGSPVNRTGTPKLQIGLNEKD